MNRRDGSFYGAVVLGVVVVSGIVLFRGFREARTAPEPRAEEAPLGESWCAEGFDLIPGGGCFVAPPGVSGAPLVIYLHGRYAPDAAAEEMERQSRLARLATAKGYAVLALRGRQGQCAAEPLRAFWCWPSNEKNASDAAAFVTSWNVALANAAQRVVDRPSHRFLLGFSNGGYFTGILATRAAIEMDAFAIAHAGPTEPVTSPSAPLPPILLVTADEDAAIPQMMRFDSLLTGLRWPHAIVTRDGGHDLTERDIAITLTFFDRVRKKEPFPLTPPLSTRVPHPNLPVDAEAPAGDAGASADSGSTAQPSAPTPAPLPESPTEDEP